jgi:hypothetical protein
MQNVQNAREWTIEGKSTALPEDIKEIVDDCARRHGLGVRYMCETSGAGVILISFAVDKDPDPGFSDELMRELEPTGCKLTAAVG